MLDLKEFFKKLNKHIYCIVKLDEKFPAYNSGSDVDIFCYNSQELIKDILHEGNQYIEKDYEILVTDKYKNEHIYIDFLLDKKIDFRFDLYNTLPCYTNISINPSFFECIIENRQKLNISNDLFVFVPCLIDELILRYIEYQEWYAKRPDKIKHADYIMNYIKDEETRDKFFNKIYHYTEIPKVYNQGFYNDSLKRNFYIRFRNYKEKLFSNGLTGIFVIPGKSISFRINRIFKKLINLSK